VALAAHCPAAGVNVYVTIPAADVLIVAGLQVPVMLFVELAGSAGAVEFRQRGPICVNVGVICGFMTTIIVAEEAH
jgi:hypothetical protein